MLGEPNVEGWGVVTKVTGKCGMKMKNKVLCIAMALACGSLGLVGCGADPTITDAGAPVDQVSNKITGNVGLVNADYKNTATAFGVRHYF